MVNLPPLVGLMGSSVVAPIHPGFPEALNVGTEERNRAAEIENRRAGFVTATNSLVQSTTQHLGNLAIQRSLVFGSFFKGAYGAPFASF